MFVLNCRPMVFRPRREGWIFFLTDKKIGIANGFDSSIKSSCADPDFFGKVHTFPERWDG